MNQPKFNIGDWVWFVRQGIAQTWVQCPDCFGKKALTVILGDGSQVSIDCVGCASGYEASRGVVMYYDWQAGAETGCVEKVLLDADGYKFTGNGFYECAADGLFSTKEDAQARAEQLAVEHNTEELNKIRSCKDHDKRSWSWNAHYHRRQLKEALRNVEYHTQKLNVAKAKVKEPENDTTN